MNDYTLPKNNVQSEELPHNIELESFLLGALLNDNDSFDFIPDILKEEHFFSTQNQVIFSLIKRTLERGQPAYVHTLVHILEKDKNFSEISAEEYLKKIASTALSHLETNVQSYAQTIYDLHVKRSLMKIGRTLFQEAKNNLEKTSEEQIEYAEHALYQLWENGKFDHNLISIGDAAKIALQNSETARKSGNKPGITTGFRDIDNLIGGLHPSDLIIIAGRPGMGKTALGTSIAYHAAKAYVEESTKQDKKNINGGKVLFFSLEMSSEQVAIRTISSQSKISGHKLRTGSFSKDDFFRLSQAANDLSSVPFFVDDSAYLSVSGIRQRARRFKRQHGLHVIVIDYLQLLTSGQYAENRVQEVSQISRALKTLAKELHVPVIALSQLSRQVEHREDNRPQLSDLRESGSIEQDADVVAFLYRQAYYLREPQQKSGEKTEHFIERQTQFLDIMEKTRNKAEFIIAKQRHGSVGVVSLYFNSDYVFFGDLDEHHTNINRSSSYTPFN